MDETVGTCTERCLFCGKPIRDDMARVPNCVLGGVACGDCATECGCTKIILPACPMLNAEKLNTRGCM